MSSDCTETVTMPPYEEMIRRKFLHAPAVGIKSPPPLHDSLFDFQAAVTRWALRRGRACLFLDTGLGKSRCALEWARVVSEHTGKPVLILTPLAVAQQFVTEGASIGIAVTHAKSGADVATGVNVTNYDRLHKFDPSVFGGVVLDESSILKNFSGRTRTELIEAFSDVRFRLCTTATPAPNDHTELGNHVEFLGIMSRVEMLSMFFVHDGGSTADWRLKRHAKEHYWRWVASWAVAIRSPEDIGYDGSRYVLPPLSIDEVRVANPAELDALANGLFGFEASGLSEQRMARRMTIDGRVGAAVDMVNASSDPWIVWCELNDESAAIAKAIPGSVEISGSDDGDTKEAAIAGFLSGQHRVLVTKPSICGMGLNFQHCAHSVFVGLGYSWERYYQAIRRVYRFGQRRPVTIKIVVSDAESGVVDAIQRKQADADAMATGMIAHMKDAMRADIESAGCEQVSYRPNVKMEVPRWLTC